MQESLAPFPLRELVGMLLAAQAGNSWQVRDDAYWCHVTPRSYPARVQGWKLHVSATRVSAPLVLYRVAQVLIARSCAFKFAGTMRRVVELTSKNADRAQAGKFITIYPRDDDELRQVASALDRATADLPGPAILSDRPVRPGSLVHYRYGAFHGVSVFTNDGAYEARLEAPDGTLVEDSRQPWFSPPSWAVLPFAGRPGRAAARPVRPKPVLLGGRFRVEKALTHTARGGVYRAVDQQTGARVVIKQARAHILGLHHIGDARDGLRHEARMLDELAGLAPAVVQLFEQGDRLFLAVEELTGQQLGVWVRQRWQDPSGTGVSVDEAVGIARQLADLVDEVHQRGLVFRDLTPGNVMMLEDGQLRLIDAELATRPGTWGAQGHTPGFVAPEVVAGAPVGPAPGPEVDHFTLGALLCYLVTGQPPAPDSPTSAAADGSDAATRSMVERIALLLEYASADNPAAQRLAPAILGLTQDDPQQRWDLARLREFLSDPDPRAGSLPGPDRGRLAVDWQQRMVADGVAHLVTEFKTAIGERLVAIDGPAAKADPCAVQYGAAGVLGVLVRASELMGQAEVAAAVARVARWIDARRMTVPTLLPGLYFGRSGTAWALYAAGRHLADDGMAERALELAAAVPVRWPNPDITHGTAGAGMASLYLWAQTKEPVFLERVNVAVDHLGEGVEETADGGVCWRVPADFDSSLAGTASYGFAHGVAGVGAFLLAAARVTGRSDAHALAVQAGQTLANAAVHQGDATYWPNDVTGPAESDLRYHWCHGASGVGTFLLRLWQHTGEEAYRQLAHEAAVMVRRGRWLVGTSHCHGLSGDGEFLLDLAATGGIGDPYRGWAEELAGCLYAGHARRNGRIVVVDEPAVGLHLDFGTGFAGVVGFLLRLRHGGPRWWMCDEGESP